ncbi:uri1, prefoldin-like chaperone [Coemansia sp. RSA 1813]|nr:uri1, prefoldin-like chaperone [Coemansia sp. RSA 1646]KAJ1773712.1 uri1, prefoldin-like chaperone [Coemansia sp. RSA 1843]KAJ2093673.1 uri1, prefoldin-like chaperone [Coemansia sp. RSA 986]KAJ2217885.1 uri1, prefoldin-like chaperone [Coemansia sp. RSA 487]KAJ2573276.1 uri1, prefoldin-like chaperone [Coemansia sp. RSA 1813]
MSDIKGKPVQQMLAGKNGREKYNIHLLQSRDSLQSTLTKLKEYKADYRLLQKTLAELPDEIEYQAMVPVGPLAFFPGKIVHTNEILVLLGDNWFVDRSAKQAAEIAKRREDYVDDRIAIVKKELQGVDKRKDIIDEEPKDGISSLIQGNLPDRMYNDDGEEIVDIKEELDEGQLPLFSEQASDRIGDKKKSQEADSGVVQSGYNALDAKRKRTIEQLSRNHASSDDNDNDYSKLSAEQREILELLDQIGSDEDEKNSVDIDGTSDSTDESDGGDVFSDEDHINALCDDDDDDYNDNSTCDDSNDGYMKLRVVEKHSPPASRRPSTTLPKGILKPRTPIVLDGPRRQAKSSSNDGKLRKSVRFNTVAEAYTHSNTELLDESNIDDNISKVVNLMSMLTASSSTWSRSPGSPISTAPKITVIDEDSAEEEEAAKPHALEEKKTSNNDLSSAVPLSFKPNTTATSGVRSSKAISSPKVEESSTITDANKPAMPKTTVQKSSMKTRIVERSPVTDEDVDMQDVVDEEMHAREIAQAYSRMRFARMSAGKLDGAADVAERVLGQVSGVSLVDQTDHAGESGHQDKDNADDDYERIELPSDLPLNYSTNNRPPEVIHQPKPKVAAIASAMLPNELSKDGASRPISKEQQQAKPKMSRFKAQRLGLSR